MSTSTTPKKRDRSRRHELQQLLGDHGEVLDRQQHGTVELPAQGWYCVLASTGELVFLGDYSMIAALTIKRIVEGTHG